MNKINWKLRFKNKVTCTAIVLQAISIIYMLLAAFNVVPKIPEGTVVEIAESIIGLLVLVGVITDPTTKGLSDSAFARTFDEPKDY